MAEFEPTVEQIDSLLEQVDGGREANTIDLMEAISGEQVIANERLSISYRVFRLGVLVGTGRMRPEEVRFDEIDPGFILKVTSKTQQPIDPTAATGSVVQLSRDEQAHLATEAFNQRLEERKHHREGLN